MKSSMKLALMGAVLAVAAGRAHAANSNYDLSVSFRLTAHESGYPTGVAITTKDVIYSLTNSLSIPAGIYTYTNATSTNTSTTLSNSLAAGWGWAAGPATNTIPGFDTNPKLVYRQVVGAGGVTTRGFFVLDGKTNTAVDVTPFITRSIGASATVGTGAGASAHSVDAFAVVSRLPIAARGVSATTVGLSSPKNGVAVLKSLQATVSGIAEVTNLFTGSITFSGGRLE